MIEFLNWLKLIILLVPTIIIFSFSQEDSNQLNIIINWWIKISNLLLLSQNLNFCQRLILNSDCHKIQSSLVVDLFTQAFD